MAISSNCTPAPWKNALSDTTGRVTSVEIRREELASPAAVSLTSSLNAELSGRYPEAGANHFRLDPDEVAHGCGAFFVAYAQAAPLGCGAIRRLDADVAEIKRMYVRTDARRRGVAQAILVELFSVARRLGASRIVLETGRRQPEAIEFYLRSGFVRIPPFGEYPDSALSICMSKMLASGEEPAPVATSRLVLSALSLDDAAPLFGYRAHPEIRRFQPFEPRRVDDARQFIADGLKGTDAWRQFGIRLKESAELVGDLGFRLDLERGEQAEIGITLAPTYQRLGLATEAARALLGHLFDTVRVHRVFASIDPDNEASARLFRRLGFRQEAHLRESLWLKGRWADDIVFAMLRSEWGE
jgi:putative acetyltransferase